jgi:WD40 repeat protein
VVATLQGVFEPVGTMRVPRQRGFSATLLADGRVLVVGGESYYVEAFYGSAEIYDPTTRTFTFTGSLREARSSHRATRLCDGRVLVTGGVNANHVAIASAELYDPTTGTFTSVGDMSTERMEHTATLLPDGKVLVASGWYDDLADRYDPATRAFTLIGSTKTANGPTRTATLLATGQVLITASASVSPRWSAELFDPATGTSARTGNMVAAQDQYTATLLDDGRVLVAGGCDTNRYATARAELYDPATGTFAAGSDMLANRELHTATRLQDGKVLIIGGFNGWTGNASAELFDPATGTFSPTGDMAVHAWNFQTATLLDNGTVLVLGGDEEGTAQVYE